METILQIPCTRCHQVHAVPYTPNEFVTENFVRVCFKCPDCVSSQQRGSKPKVKTMMAPARQPAKASLPYKDA
jgi:hypothetical protein